MIWTYVTLQKQLHQESADFSQSQLGKSVGTSAPPTPSFRHSLREAVSSLNDIFLAKEEDAIIQMETLQSAAQARTGKSSRERHELYRELVEFHGKAPDRQSDSFPHDNTLTAMHEQTSLQEHTQPQSGTDTLAGMASSCRM